MVRIILPQGVEPRVPGYKPDPQNRRGRVANVHCKTRSYKSRLYSLLLDVSYEAGNGVEPFPSVFAEPNFIRTRLLDPLLNCGSGG